VLWIYSQAQRQGSTVFVELRVFSPFLRRGNLHPAANRGGPRPASRTFAMFLLIFLCHASSVSPTAWTLLPVLPWCWPFVLLTRGPLTASGWCSRRIFNCLTNFLSRINSRGGENDCRSVTDDMHNRVSTGNSLQGSQVLKTRDLGHPSVFFPVISGFYL